MYSFYRVWKSNTLLNVIYVCLEYMNPKMRQFKDDLPNSLGAEISRTQIEELLGTSNSQYNITCTSQ